MQYVRSLAGSVSKTYNSLNPATLSGAIDVIVIEQEDGTLSCSPFHVRFGKFSLLRPSEKKVEFCVNGEKQDYAMKLGDAGEAFFVFETQSQIPPSMQTSPLVSPAQSPETLRPAPSPPPSAELFSEPTFLDIADDANRPTTPDTSLQSDSADPLPIIRKDRANTDVHVYTSLADETQPASWSQSALEQPPVHPALNRAVSEELLPTAVKEDLVDISESVRRGSFILPDSPQDELKTSPTASSPPTLGPQRAYDRAMTLSKKLSHSQIRSTVTESGDLMLDMTGYKSSEDQALRAEALARKLLSEEIEGHQDIGSLIGTDENGNLWIYSSEEAKDAANRRAINNAMANTSIAGSSTNDTASDPGYHSDSDQSSSLSPGKRHIRAQSEELPNVRQSSESSHFAKTLRLTSDQLKKLNLKPGPNPISFTVNKATCQANMFLWTHDVPIVISDIDGTITKSDALGQVFNMVGKDWTHIGVAKLYSDIVANGYNIFYLTSRSVGQADMTRAYLKGVVQDGWKLPKGPVIMSPDRTIAALRREVYLRKPEVFKMACLRDILGLFPGRTNPFYAGFGNRFTDALSYRTVNIPSNRIFTINSKAEVKLDLISLSSYKASYVSIREVVDHSFPPVATLVKDGGEEYTDFKYWRDDPSMDLDNFVPSDSEDDDEASAYYEEEEEVDERFHSRRGSDRRPSAGTLDDALVVRESIEMPLSPDQELEINQLRIVDSIRSQSAASIGSGSESDGDDYDEDEFVEDYVESNKSHRTREMDVRRRREMTAPI